MNATQSFRGKNIFITGGSGFVGKALIEKILRTIPDVGDIYVLLRVKKGKTPQERLTDVLNNDLFDTLKESNPSVFGKVKCIAGDVLELKLGINDIDRKALTDNVDIIYNCAASVSFNDPLRHAILSSVRSTRELIELAKEAKHLKAFVHVSTAYCNADKTYVEEKLYPPHGNWREAIQLAEEYDSYTLDVFTQKYIHPLPNTYTYAKSLAEHTVHDLCYGQIPTIIVRPSIVINMKGDPLPGWTDNLNGPIGLFIFGATGLLRIAYGRKDTYLDCTPIDVTARVLVLSTCECIQNQNLNEIKIYNNSLHGCPNFTLHEYMEFGMQSVSAIPFAHTFWYPTNNMTNCKYDYLLKVIVFHIIPALLIDLLLRIIGQKPRLYNIQKKVYLANQVLHRFIEGTWTFTNNNTMALESKMSPEDLPEYRFSHLLGWTADQMIRYLQNCHGELEKLLFKTNIDLDTKKKRFNILWILDKACSILSYVLLIWLIMKTNILGIFYNSLANYVNSL